MRRRRDLLGSIAGTIRDFRKDDLPEPTPDHVDKWIRQFDSTVQLKILLEMDHVLRRTYFSQSTVRKFLTQLIDNPNLAGNEPREFWRTAHLLDIQQEGNSQTEIRTLFLGELEKKYGIVANEGPATPSAYVYLDDALFSGNRIGSDLKEWMATESPSDTTVHVVVIALHSFGHWKCSERLRQEAQNAGKQLRFEFWSAVTVENRLAYRNESEVLWPATIPDDAALRVYMEEETRFPFTPRGAGGQLECRIFSSENSRQLLESELLLAGMRIRSLSQNPSRALRPLGFSPFGLGFGSMIVTYRNCPNNAPLALWWGDPSADKNHPLSRWHPLVQRKTYTS